MKYHEEYDVFYLGDGDPYVFTEQKRDYGRVAHRALGAQVLDFGAHCGFFNVFLNRNHTPNHIISVEPNPNVMEVLRRNCDMSRTTIIEAAVVNHDIYRRVDHLPLHLGKTFSAVCSLEHYRGREIVHVSTVSFQELCEKVHFIKCDCEGGEYLLDWSCIPDIVHTIAIEFHFHRPQWEQQMVMIDKQLLFQGFHHIKAPKLNTFQKINTGLYVRG